MDQSVQNGAITSDERIRNVLRRHIKRAYDNRDFTRLSLATESRVNVHTIDAIVSRDASKQRRVACEDALCIAYALGEEAVSALLATIQYAARPLDDGDAMQPMLVAATAMQHLSTIATAAADGRIDHTEAPACREAADLIIATVLPLSSAGGAA